MGLKVSIFNPAERSAFKPLVETSEADMANMLTELRKKRENGEINTASSEIKIAGEGHFTVQVTEASWGKNREGTAEQGKVNFKVVAVRKDTDPKEIGGTFSEYVSLKNEEMMQKKYLQISDWMSKAGVKDEKMVDEDDDTLEEALRTLILALQKYAPKKEILVNCFRKQTDKLAANGKPYFSNYFDDPFSSDDDEEGEQAGSKPAAAPAPATAAAEPPKQSKPGVSPFKKGAHAADEDED